MGFENLPETTADLAQEQMAKLRALFPECVTEGQDGLTVDFDLLRRALSPEKVVEGPNERYRLEWPGKRAARYAANASTASTLRPVRERSKDFDTTQNLYIEGDNLEALKLLRTAYSGKVKLIYIDPPYNTGHDFIYHDKYVRSVREEMAKAGLIDDEGRQTEDKDPFQKNDETNGRYHSDWLTMMYPRLLLARDLLTDDGVIFISIDDNEQANLKRLCDEVFGAGNFVAQINWKARSGREDSTHFAALHEYILCYSRSYEFQAGERIREGDVYPKYDEVKKRRYKTQLLRKWGSNSLRTDRPNLFYPIKAPDGTDVYPMIYERVGKGGIQPATFVRKTEGCWRWSASNLFAAIEDGRVEFTKNELGEWIPYEKIFEPLEGEQKTQKYTTWIDDIGNGTEELKKLFGRSPFSFPKSTSLIKRLMAMGNLLPRESTGEKQESDLVLDFFSGSATTAHVVMALNAEDGGTRKFIMVQLPEAAELGSAAMDAGFQNICDIGEERIRRAGEKILEEYPELRGKLDVGFRVLRVDEKNEAEVAQTPDDALTNWEAALQEETIKEGRTEEDLLFQALLRVTEPLLVERIEREVMAGLTVWSVADGFVVACLAGEGQLTAAKAEAVTRWIVGQAVSPSYVAFREAGFADDSVKLNVEAGLRQAGCKATLWVL